MFIADYNRSRGWGEPQIVPYGPLSLDPGSSVLHYGQALFEGMKAFRQTTSGRTVLFNPDFNYLRMQQGADRLCMEMPSKETFIEGIRALVEIDQSWVPTSRGSSLYLRPTLIGTEAFLGVRPSDEYRFFVIASPVSSYYKEGLGPVKIWVEPEYVRAAPGGLGATKAAANYAGSLKAAYQAKQNGYAQVLWLDVTRQFVEEVGTMNVFFIIDGKEAHTPALDGTILPGGVRQVVIDLLKEMGLKVVERKIPWKELVDLKSQNKLTEAFGTGTAAVISPIGELTSAQFKLDFSGAPSDQGKDLGLSYEPFKYAKKLYEQISGIQYGEIPDKHGWITDCCAAAD